MSTKKASKKAASNSPGWGVETQIWKVAENDKGAKNAKVLTTDKHKRMRIFNRERRQTG
jgi:hypothetical protein